MLRALCKLGTLVLMAGWLTVAWAEEGMRFGVIPLLNTLDLTERFTPLLELLGHRLGETIRMEVPANFHLLIQKVGEHQLDVAYLGPVPYLRLVAQYGEHPILAMEELAGQRSYHGVIFVRQDSPIRELGELAGRRFAFGDPDSTMNHTLPKMMLARAGVGLTDLAAHAFVGNNQNVVLSVLMGQFDAAGVKEDVYQQYASRGLRPIARSLPVPNLMFVAGRHLPAARVARMRQAMIALHQSPEGQAALKQFNPQATALVLASADDFKALRAFLQDGSLVP